MHKLLIVILVLFLASTNARAEDPSLKIYEQMHACTNDDDCVQAPEVFNACFHYCKGDKCTAAKDCPLFNKYFKNFPDCAVNVPCKSNPEGIVCINQKCARK